MTGSFKMDYSENAGSAPYLGAGNLNLAQFKRERDMSKDALEFASAILNFCTAALTIAALIIR